MEDFKGTKGPWEIGHYVKSYVFGKNGKKHIAALGIDEEEEDVANALLVAAAPDLLEALQEIRNHLNSIKKYSNDQYFIDKADLLINKALGR